MGHDSRGLLDRFSTMMRLVWVGWVRMEGLLTWVLDIDVEGTGCFLDGHEHSQEKWP